MCTFFTAKDFITEATSQSSKFVLGGKYPQSPVVICQMWGRTEKVRQCYRAIATGNFGRLVYLSSVII